MPPAAKVIHASAPSIPRVLSASLLVLITAFGAEPAAAQNAGRTYPIDATNERLGAALERLRLLDQTDRESLRLNPASSLTIVRRDAKLQPVYKQKVIKGSELRDSFATLKATSLSDQFDEATRESIRKTLASSVAQSEAPRAKSGRGRRYPVDPRKEPFAAKFVKYFSRAELEHFESIDPDADLTITVMGDDGSPVPITDVVQGVDVRNSYWILKAESVREKLDARTTALLNDYVYDKATVPAKGTPTGVEGERRLHDFACIVLGYRDLIEPK